MQRITTLTKAENLFGTGKHGFKDGNGTDIAPTDLNALWFNGMQEELVAGLIEWAGLVPNNADNTQVRQALLAKFLTIATFNAAMADIDAMLDGKQPAHAKLDALVNLASTANRGLIINGAGALALGKVVQFMPKATIRALAGDIGPVIVEETAGEAWKWTTFGAYFTGYASPSCGYPIYGVDAAPRAHEIDAIGGTFLKADYPELWGWAQWRGLVKSQAEFDGALGSYWFVADPGGDATKFRAPNLLGPNSWGMFLRMAAGGIDADTANAVALGSRKLDTFKAHSHEAVTSFIAGGAGNRARSNDATADNTQTGSAGTAETAPRHVAFHPRIHV